MARIAALLALVVLAAACGPPPEPPPRTARPGIAALGFSPDGALLALARDGQVFRWSRDLQPRPGRTVSTHQLQAAAFSPQGGILALGYHDRRLEVCDVEGNAPPARLPGHLDGILALAFSPDSRLLASGADDPTGRLWALPGGRPAGLLEGAGEALTALAFSADGERVAGATWSGRLALWKASGGEALDLRAGPGGFVVAVALAPDGAMLAASQEGVLSSCPADGPPRVLLSHPPGLRSLALAPGGREAALGGADGAVLLVSPDGRTRPLGRHRRYVQALAWSADGRLASGAEDGTVLLWEPDSDRPGPITPTAPRTP